MDEEAHLANDSGIMLDAPGVPAYTGAFFSGAHDFVLSGGTFTSVTNINYTAPSVSADFRMVPIGDIDLRKLRTITLNDDTGVVLRRHGQALVKRTYSSRLCGRNSSMTVIMYHGNGADEEWRHDISKYLSFRHPNLMQFYGAAASSSGLRAVILHDDLIPISHIMKSDHHSHSWILYIYTCFDAGIQDVMKCLRGYYIGMSCRGWLRISTGTICLDVGVTPNDTDPNMPANALGGLSALNNLPVGAAWCAVSCFDPQPESRIFASLSLDAFHSACFNYFCQEHLWMSAPDAIVRLGSVIRFGLPGLQSEELAEAPTMSVGVIDWWKRSGTVLENGWIRIDSWNMEQTMIRSVGCNPTPWITQANHIFSRLRITSNHEQCILVRCILYSLCFSETKHELPKGYLFVCPLEDMQMNSSTSFRRPSCPAYWCLDPSGEPRLSALDAERLGFPSVSLSMQIEGSAWNQSVYTGLRDFYRSKGFDPNSQDVARHLKQPLYQLSEALSVSFAHIDGEVSDHDVQGPHAESDELNGSVSGTLNQ
ncbi:hypothetical protein FB451DRAFT_1259136 [Mycena latifolia]|nr:hypothetical protein FB451DRAFT_1259136 [Mycena latifolia]